MKATVTAQDGNVLTVQVVNPDRRPHGRRGTARDNTHDQEGPRSAGPLLSCG